MATLTGKRQRTVVDSIEVVLRDSDGGEHVLQLTRSPQLNTTSVKVRRAHESYYEAGASATLSDDEAQVVAAVITGGDQAYRLDTLRAIEYQSYTTEDVNRAAVDREVEARCSQLDIERARAANLAEEAKILAQQLVVQHADGKHDRDVENCAECEKRIRPGHGDGSITDQIRDNLKHAGITDPEDDGEPLPF